MLHHARLRCESKITQSAKPIETGNRGKGRLDPPGGENTGRRGSGHHTLAVLVWERFRCTSGETPGTDSSSVTRVKVCPLPREASLNTGSPIPFLRSLMLRTCERVSSAGTINAPSSFPSGKRILSSRFESFQRGDWHTLLEASGVSDFRAAQSRHRSRRRHEDEVEQRALRAEGLI